MEKAWLMLGDSLTFRNDWSTMLGRSVLNHGIDGDTTYGVLHRLEHINLTAVERVVLMIGINDIAQGETAADIFERYVMIIEYFLDRRIPLFVQSTLYVSADFYDYKSFNDEVDTLNVLVRQYAAQRDFVFLDINRHLSYNGALKRDCTHDGVHLNQKAYALWAQQLKI
jgi:lysophospholipase L1-like esterase